MSTIAKILAGIDSAVTPAKRRIVDALMNPKDYAAQAFGQVGENVAQFGENALRAQDGSQLDAAGSVMGGLPQYKNARSAVVDALMNVAPIGATGGKLYRANVPGVADQTSETLLSQTLGRGTGHFGTGTYWVKDKNALKTMLSKGKELSENTVPEGMFQPVTTNQAFLTHDALRTINDAAHMQRLDPKFTDKIKNELRRAGLPFDEDALRRSLAIAKNVYRQPGWEAQRMAGKGKDSVSTMYMKSLGYKGVDVSDLPDLDNTMYGTVLYR
jgi:hypothetical protein